MANDLEKRISEASDRLREIERRRDDEIREAKAAITEKYEAERSAASKALYEAKKAHRDHIDATASHPWDGKRVYRERPVFSRWSSKQTGTERLDGVVEVVRQSSQFPGNITYGRPSLGMVIVRKLKKDGTAALAMHQLRGSLDSEGWKLAE